ncbi:MAG: hypothetical protein HOC71_14655 [Candidatus Latescibacteria bacterium]|nr:hypothetical protein [Candidatus Latescibacterota bacterium]
MLILVSWPATMYVKFGNPLAPHSASVGPFQFKIQQNLDEMNNAIMLGNFPCENRFQQIYNSLTSNSIYYKTFSEIKYRFPLFKFVKTILGTYFFLFAGFLVSFNAMRGMWKFRKKLLIEFLIIGLWFIIPLVLWFFIDEKMATTKYFIASIPVWCFAVVSVYFKSAASLFQRKRFFAIVTCLLLLRVFLLEIGSSYAEVDSTGVFPSWEKSFEKEYGYKLQFINKCREFGITPENSLMMVRGEHGAFFVFFLGNSHFWEYKWYESPVFEKLHKAISIQEVIKQLKINKIKYIIAMNNSELERFYALPFQKTNPLFKENLVKMIFAENHNLQKIYSEPEKRGLELTIYEVYY